MNHEAARRANSFVHLCWKGAAEIVVPVIHEGAHVCTLFAGTWKSSIETYGPAAETMPSALETMRASLPAEDSETMRAMMGPLQLLGIGLVNLWLPMMRLSGEADRVSSIRRYLHLRVTKDIRLADLAAYLHLSESRTGVLVRESLGCSFQEAVLNERLRRSQHLLRHSRHPVKIIAERVGFKSEYYFSRVFTKRIGLPPGKWRSQQD
jgi:AraC-like DNA-binding protein